VNFQINGDILKMEIKPDQIVDLFNSKLAKKGKMKPCPSFFLPMVIVQDFLTMRSYPKFDKLETWEEYFSIVERSSFLMNQFTPSLPWLLKAENAFKVFSGQYDDKDIGADKKDDKNRYGEAQAMASDLFDQVIRSGNHGLMELLGNLEPIQREAINKFGRASEILNCTSSQSESIKKRLTSAFLKCLE